MFLLFQKLASQEVNVAKAKSNDEGMKMKCAHPENKGNSCDWESCPMGLYEIDWDKRIEDKCTYIRQNKWKPKDAQNHT